MTKTSGSSSRSKDSKAKVPEKKQDSLSLKQRKYSWLDGR